MSNFFQLKENKTTVKTEILAGITTFLATMYIIVVNPGIISHSGMPFSGILTATVLVSAFSSIMMGIYAKNPIVIAPGMGLNAFFTYSVVKGMEVEWTIALGAVFWSGIIFIILSVFNIRTEIVKAIPKQIRFAVAAGIGIFITLIGFTDAGFIIHDPSTLLSMGPLNSITLTFLAGLAVTAILVALRVKGAIIIGIVTTTLISIPIGRWYGDASTIVDSITLVNWNGFFAMPDFSVFFKLKLIESIQLAIWPVIFAFLFTDLFDSISTFIGVAEAAQLYDTEGEPRNIKQSLIVDAVSTTISGLFGSSSGTSYIESATGIEEGGRSGLTAVVAGLLFLPFMFLSPILSIVPTIATAPALVIVGAFMMRPVTRINWTRMDDAIPAFLALTLIPLTYNITIGIIWGLLSWTIIKLVMGHKAAVTPMLIIIDIFAILALIIG
ncbi:MAG: NCS2 family permease [Caldithrix sp.]|nr:NCS2 family permease [Caldithrix sp.]